MFGYALPRGIYWFPILNTTTLCVFRLGTFNPAWYSNVFDLYACTHSSSSFVVGTNWGEFRPKFHDFHWLIFINSDCRISSVCSSHYRPAAASSTQFNTISCLYGANIKHSLWKRLFIIKREWISDFGMHGQIYLVELRTIHCATWNSLIQPQTDFPKYLSCSRGTSTSDRFILLASGFRSPWSH